MLVVIGGEQNQHHTVTPVIVQNSLDEDIQHALGTRKQRNCALCFGSWYVLCSRPVHKDNIFVKDISQYTYSYHFTHHNTTYQNILTVHNLSLTF